MCWKEVINFAIAVVELLQCVFFQPVKLLAWINIKLHKINREG